jgi:tetratricopeptide (TPR) repeat protein
MNFAKIFVPNSTKFVLICDEPSADIETALTREKSDRTLTGTALKVLDAEKKETPRLAYKLRLTEKRNIFANAFQPVFIAKGRTSVNEHQTVLEVETRLPKLPLRLINWAANMSLYALFGIIGSYLLLPNPTPVADVFIKLTVLPLLFAGAMSASLRIIVVEAQGRMSETLTKTSGALQTNKIDYPHAATVRGVIFSWDTLFTFMILGALLGTATNLHWQAWELWKNGDYQASEKLCTPVLKLAEYVLGKESSGAAGCDYYLAECSRCEGKYDQARAYYQKALSIYRQNLAADNPAIADGLLNLGRVEDACGNYKLAKQYYEQANHIYDISPMFGPKCIWIGHVKNKIAALLLNSGDLEGARQNAEKALAVDRTYRQYAYRSVPEDLNDLGVILYKQQNFQEAERKLRESLSQKATDPINDEYSIALTSENLSIVLSKLGRQEEAENLHKQAVRKMRDYLTKHKIEATAQDVRVLYQKVLDSTKASYETPNYDTRAEMLIDGPCRI